MSTIGEFILALGFGKVDEKPLDDAVAKGEAGAKKVESAWLSAAKGIGKGFAAIGAAAIGVGGALFGLAENSAGALAAIDDLAKRSGHSAKDIQRLQFAAQQGGASADEMTAALRKLQLSLVDAGKGSGPASDALDVLGIKFEDIADLGAEDALGVIADALQTIHDPALRTSLAVDLLGKGGTALIPVLEGGSAALREAGDEAERLGLVFGDDVVAAGAELDDTISAMKATLVGLFTSIGVEGMPIVQEWLGELSAWIKENRELVKTKVREAVLALVNAIEVLAPIAGELVQVMIDVVGWFDESESSIMNMIPALAALGIAVTAAAGPWGALAAALVLVIAKFDEIVEAASRAIEAIDPFSEIRDAEIRKAEGGDIGVHGTRQANVFLPGEARDKQAMDAAAKATHEANMAASTAVAIASGQATARAAQNAALRGRQRALANSKKKGGKGKAFEADLDAGVFEFDESHGDELRRLASRHGVGEVGIDAALKAGAASIAEGASADVARQAALSKLGGLAGQDFTTKGGKDPLLSQILGDENVPDVALSSIARGAEPQVLISNITNTFNFDNDFAIDGAREPGAVAHAVVKVIEDTLQAAIEQSTKTAKVVTAR